MLDLVDSFELHACYQHVEHRPYSDCRQVFLKVTEDISQRCFCLCIICICIFHNEMFCLL